MAQPNRFFSHLPFTRSARALAVTSLLSVFAGCSGTPETREAAHMAKGKGYLGKKDYRRAVIEYKVASQNMPKDAEPLYQLGMTYLAAGSARLAYETFSKAATVNPKHPGAQYQLALFKVGSNKPETVQEGKKVLSDYIKSHPDDEEALGSLALAEAKLGNKEESISLLQRSVEKNPSHTRPAAVIIALYAAKGDIETARTIARDLADRFPNSPEAAVLRAEVSLATKDLADADLQIGRALGLKRDFRPALQLRLRRELMNGNPQSAEQTTQELSKLPDKQTWAAYGRMLFAENKIDQGISEFDRVLKEHNNDPEIRDQYSALLMTAGRKKEAEAVVAGTLQKNPKDRTALLQRVTLAADSGNFDQASQDVKALLEMKAPSAQLSYQQSRIFAARGDTTRQGDMLAEALKYNPRLLLARLDLVRLLLSVGKARTALDILDQTNANERGTAEYSYFRTMALMASGNFAEARKNVDTALKITRSPGFLYQDALLRMQSKDLAGARKSLEESLKSLPTDSGTLNLLGEVMRQQGQSKQFVALVQSVAAKNPGVPQLQDMLGAQLAGVGDQKGARAAFEAAKNAGDMVNAEIQLAVMDMQNGAMDQAWQRLTEISKSHDSARVRIMLAEIDTRKGMPAEEVVQHYLKAIQLEPTNIPAMNNLADVLASRQNKFDDALFWAQKALAVAPGSPVVEDTIGWIYYRQGKYDAAVPYLEKSLKGLDRPLAHYHLAAALLKTGDSARAKREYQAGLKQDSKSPAKDAVAPLFQSN
jgi:tetratricopeptide (TPR) repeat protein